MDKTITGASTKLMSDKYHVENTLYRFLNWYQYISKPVYSLSQICSEGILWARHDARIGIENMVPPSKDFQV